MGAFYPQWTSIVRIDVTNPPSVTGYQVKVEIPWVPGMNDDFSDLRFSDYYRTLPYWIETSTTRSTATVWVKLTEINAACQEFFCYYGNGGAASESSGANTFEFFDDFLGTSLNATYWGTSTATVSDSVVSLTPGQALSGSVMPGWGTNTALRAKMKTAHNYPVSSGENIFYGSKSALWNNRIYFDTGAPGNAPGFQTAISGSYQETGYITGWTVDTWHKVDILRNGATSVILIIDAVTKATHTSYVPQHTDSIIYSDSSGIGSSSFDWILLRKYQSTEPTCTPATYGINTAFYQTLLVGRHVSIIPGTFGTLYPGWLYKIVVSVTNPPTITGYQVKVEIPWMPGMRDDFADLRFSDYYRTLPYWIETSTTRSTATVWVKLTEINAACQEFFCYYGNGGSSSESSGDNTFDFFDHFDGASLDTNKWTGDTGGTYASQANSILTYSSTTTKTDTRAIASLTTFNTDTDKVRLRAYGKIPSTTGLGSIIGLQPGKADGTARAVFLTWSTAYSTVLTASQGWGSNGIYTNAYHIFEILYEPSVHTHFYVDNSSLTQHTCNSPSDLPILINSYTNTEGTAGKTYLDWIFIGKYQATEPTCTPTIYTLNWIPPRVVEYIGSGSVGGTTSVEIESDLQYAIKATKTLSTKNLLYTVVRSIGSTKDLAYTVNKTPSAWTTNLAYSVCAPKQTTKTLQYDIVRSVQLGTKNLGYTVSTSISDTTQITYTVAHEIESQETLTYSVQAGIGIQEQLGYCVQSSQSDTKSLMYTISVGIQSTQLLTYTISSPVVSQLDLAYTIILRTPILTQVGNCIVVEWVV